MYQRVLVATGLSAIAVHALAAPVAVVNPGFEDTTGSAQTFNEFTFGAPNGWQPYASGAFLGIGNGPTFWIGTLDPTERDPIGNPGVNEFFPAGAPQGNRVGIAFNFVGGANAGEYGMRQTLAATLQPNTTYTLQVDIGNIASGFGVNNAFFNLNGFPGYRVDLLAGGVVLASDNNSLAGTIPEGQFATSTLVYNSPAAHAQLDQPLMIRLVNLNVTDPSAPGADLEIDFDDVRLDASPVPEPASIGSLGALLLMLKRRRA